MVDIRTKTMLVIRKDGRYLMTFSGIYKRIVWTASPWEAWQTRRLDHACMVRDKVGGTLVLFNPIVGKTKEYQSGCLAADAAIRA